MNYPGKFKPKSEITSHKRVVHYVDVVRCHPQVHRAAAGVSKTRSPRQHVTRAPRPRFRWRVQSKAAASTFSDPNATADPAEVYAVGETVDDGEHIVSAAAWIVARQSSLDPDSRCGVFAMYAHR